MRLVFFFLLFNLCQAYEFKYLNRSPRGLLMGDAYTTLAEDSHSLFYNPALLARNDLFAFYPAPISIGATNFLAAKDKFDDLDTNNTEDFAAAVMGEPLHFQAGATPTIKLMGFGFTPFAVSTMNAILLDATHPVLDIDYRLDRGFATGFAWTIGKKKGAKGSSTAIGLAAKYINRQGIVNQFDVFGKEVADIIASDNSDFDQIRRGLGYSQGKGWGVDAGADYRYVASDTEFRAGLSFLDIGDTKITTNEGTDTLPDQQMSVNMGFSFGQFGEYASWVVAADLHPLNSNIQTLQKVHLGAKVKFTFFELMAGWNGGYASYGAGIDFFPFEIMVGFYDKEIGKEIGDTQSKRIIAYISLFDFTFDGP